MTTRTFLVSSLSICILLAACGRKNNKKQAPKPDNQQQEQALFVTTDTTVTEEGFMAPSYENEKVRDNKSMDESAMISSIVALPFSNDTSKKFIKTAKVKFKVKNMLNATYGVEDITRHYGGYITYTSLQTEIRATEYAEISEDSMLKRTHYTVVNNITLRVPAEKLDSTLRSFTPFIDFLDYRTITAEDISLRLITNHLVQLRIKNQRVRIDKKSTARNSSLDDITNSEEVLLNRQEQADASLIENMQMMDQVKYSTIELSIYQDEKIKMETIYNPKSLNAYNSGFSYKLKRSFNKGLHGVESFILFMVQFWVLFVIAIVVFATVKIVIRIRR